MRNCYFAGLSLGVFSLICAPSLTGETSAPTPPPSADSAKDARSLYEAALANLKKDDKGKTHPDRALNLMREAVALGYPDAYNGLGYLYGNGLGVERDDEEAARLFRLGAGLGSAKSQYALSVAIARGRGVAKDDKEAAEWLQKAADADLPEAQAVLAEAIMLERLGFKLEYAKVWLYAEPAAKSGNPLAQNILGVLYQYGYSRKKDVVAAEEWFRKAAAQGYAKARFNLGQLIGVNRPERRVEALVWLMEARNQGDVMADKFLNEVLSGLPQEAIDKATALTAGGANPETSQVTDN